MRRTAFVLAILLLGCPPADRDKGGKSSPAACAKVGDTCEFSPGKLGTCVAKDGCTSEGASCLVCQSQH